jgi:hypothetical protein
LPLRGLGLALGVIGALALPQAAVASPTATAAKQHQKTKPGLPLKAVPVSTRTGDNVGAVRLILRPLKRARVGPVRIAFRNSRGHLISRKRVADPGGQQEIVALPISKPLHAGTYRVQMVGRRASGGALLSATRKIVFAKGGGWTAPPVTGALVQKVVVDWYGGQWGGRDTAGFVAPGIGYGEVVCNPETQYVRVFGSYGAREVAMMNWTYKNWGSFQEKSLREAIYTSGTGFDFNEGLNKFNPAEKTSTGSFEGVISDRGPVGNPGGVTLAPPTTLRLNWEWDFTAPAESHCHVEAVFGTETAATTMPLARSAQVVWRGEANAAANGYSAVDFPGLGTVAVRCEPGAPRQLTVASPSGAKVTTREGSEDSSLREPSGPVATSLPNNGMVVLEMDSGQRIVVASRWKLNDPDPNQNWCAIAAQVLSPGFPGS